MRASFSATIATIGLLLFVTAAGQAQTAGSAQLFQQLSHWYGLVTGRPYTGLVITTIVNTAPNGISFRHVDRMKVARASDGRTYSDLFAPPGCTYVCGNLVTIVDFSRHTITSWDTYNKIVTVHGEHSRALPPNVVAVPPRSGVIITKAGSVRYEDLGWRTIENVSARGARQTVTYPAGSFGSDRPVTTTQEVWYAPDIEVQVLWVSTDYTGATTTRALTDIHPGEPDPTLFEPPNSDQTPK